MVVLFISHVHFLREAVVMLLRGSEMSAVHTASSREGAEAAVEAAEPTLVMIDSSHPEAMTIIAAIRAHTVAMPVVVLAMCDQDEDFLAWADIGISGYVGPESSARDLISTLRRAGAGEVVCPPRLTALLLNHYADRSTSRATRAGIHALTLREREVVELLADGLPNKLIARRLCVAVPTVKNHVHSILDKWDVRSRGEAAARYRQKIQEIPTKAAVDLAKQTTPHGTMKSARRLDRNMARRSVLGSTLTLSRS